jgi:hypothetical protein
VTQQAVNNGLMATDLAMMTPFAIPELAIIIGVIGTAIAGTLWRPAPKRVPARARRGRVRRNS